MHYTDMDELSFSDAEKGTGYKMCHSERFQQRWSHYIIHLCFTVASLLVLLTF